MVPYSDLWPEIFKKEKLNLMKILGKNSFLDIQHVGSTSIPSIDAKTIIDIGIAVESFEKSKTLIQPMIDAGYTYKGEFGIPGRHLFFKYDNGLALFHVHMNEITSREWMDQIYFRDFLRNNEEKSKEYCELKNSLREKFPFDRTSNTNGKSEFIQSILKTR